MSILDGDRLLMDGEPLSPWLLSSRLQSSPVRSLDTISDMALSSSCPLPLPTEGSSITEDNDKRLEEDVKVVSAVFDDNVVVRQFRFCL